MARLFDDAQNEFLQIDSAVITDYPFAMACMFNTDQITDNNVLMWVGDKDSATFFSALQARGNVGGDPVRAFSHNYGAAGTGSADTSSGYSANTWHHAAGLWTGVNDRRVWIDGGSKGTDSTVVNAMINHDRTALGRAGDDPSPGGYLSGQMAFAGFWDLSSYPGATNSDKGDYWETHVLPGLAARWSALSFPLGLAAFYPLGGFDTEETDGGTARDIWGGFDLTAFSDATGPGIADHPGGLIYPSQPMVVGAPGGGAPPPPTGAPWYYYQQQVAGAV